MAHLGAKELIMKTLTILFTVAACLAAPFALAQEMSLDDALAALPKYTFGEDRTALAIVGEALRDAANESAEALDAIEVRVVAVLQGECSVDAARFICAQLAIFGGKPSVEALTPLLHNAELAESALDALERNQTEFARIALHQTVESASGVVRIGAIQALAVRGDAGKNDLLMAIANDAPAPERLAAIHALGKVGGASALEPLAAIAAGDDEALGSAANQSRLKIGARLGDAGDTAQARAVYDALSSPANPAYVRAAALAGKIALQPAEAEVLITEAFEDEDPEMQRLAMGFLREVEGDALPRVFADKLTEYPASTQVLVLATLRDRASPISPETFGALLSAEDEAVRLAAIDAMPACGGEAVVPLLLDTAVQQGREVRRMARAALVALQGESIDGTLQARIACDAPEVADEALRALAGRAATGAVADVLALLAAPCPALEARAWSTLEALAQPSDVVAMLGMLDAISEESARSDAERAIASAARRGPDRAVWADAVVARAEDAQSEATAHSLLRVLGSIANEPALEVLRAAAREGDPATQSVAITALAGWDSLAPAGELMGIATGAEGSVRTQALSGALDLLRKHGAATPGTQAELLQQAAGLVSSEGEKRSFLAAVSTLPKPLAFELVAPYAGEAAFAAEVAQARLAVSRNLLGAYPGQVREALAAVQAATENDAVREQAAQLLASLDAMGAYVTAWQVSGPYSDPGKSGIEQFWEVFAPEQANAEAAWRVMPMALDPAMPFAAALGKHFGDCGCAAFLRTYLQVDGATDAVLTLGSNDGLRVWLNGQLVHETNDGRPLNPGQDRIPVNLTAGWNTVLLKVVNHGGDWGAAMGVEGVDGAPVPGLKVAVEAE
jgi:hypothetical protein